jgi:kynurenine 3-monooxygenase
MTPLPWNLAAPVAIMRDVASQWRGASLMSDHDTFTIVGSGLAGALLACYLGKAGRRAVLYEKRPDPRAGPSDRGRSINLALSTRGLHALGEVGLLDAVVRESILMRGRMIHHPDRSLTFQPYGNDDTQALHSVSRAGLNRLLVEAAATYPTIESHFGHRCVGADLDAGTLEFAHGDEVKRIEASVIVGADGAFSAVRAAMLQRRERFDYVQEFLTHGYKELTIPAGPGGTFRIEKHALHVWPRGSFMMIALPNADGSFTCTLFWPFEGDNSFAALRKESDVRAFFEKEFPDAVPLLPDLVSDFLHNPTGSLVTVRCRPWHVDGKAVLVGDACHAVVPFLGQGMNAAFEDCSVLMECLAKTDDRSKAFTEYEARRKPHLDVLAELCVENFVEMRDRVGSRLFVLRKKLNLLLHALMPSWYLPLYVMVEFTRIPYRDAVERAKRQERIVAGVGLALLLLGLLLLAWLVLR